MTTKTSALTDESIRVHSTPFELDSLSQFGLTQAVAFVRGQCAKPLDFNLGEQLSPLIEHLDAASKSPYYNLGSEQRGLYMEREWLIEKSKENPAARVHRIHRSDLDRAAHNHPWNHFSVILEYGYYELVPSLNGKENLAVMPPHLRDQVSAIEPLMAIERKPGDVIFRTPNMRHKLIVRAPSLKPLTLFVTAKKSQEWGFFTETGFVEHTVYLNGNVQTV